MKNTLLWIIQCTLLAINMTFFYVSFDLLHQVNTVAIRFVNIIESYQYDETDNNPIEESTGNSNK